MQDGLRTQGVQGEAISLWQRIWIRLQPWCCHSSQRRGYSRWTPRLRHRVKLTARYFLVGPYSAQNSGQINQFTAAVTQFFSGHS